MSSNPENAITHSGALPGSRAARIAIVILAVVVIAITGAAISFLSIARSALPQLDGSLAISGLSAPVTVIRDAHGIPTIDAATLDDLFIAQGYITAQDRLFQMDGMRRFAAGELSEILGSDLLKHDRAQRIYGLREAAKKAALIQSDDDRRYFEDYARGVNAYIHSQREHLPLEFRILGYDPRPWDSVASMLIAAQMVEDLSSDPRNAITREKILGKLGPELTADLYVNTSTHDHPPDQTLTSSIQQQMPQHLKEPEKDSISTSSATHADSNDAGRTHKISSSLSLAETAFKLFTLLRAPFSSLTSAAEPKPEPPHRYANDTYVVFHKTYSPLPAGAPYRASGIASWYGRKFHGQRTATGEIYDMYAMTAAHTTLAIPSYVRVTNLKNGKAVIVRVNDRGPFHSKRVIDLSYAAAYKLGFISAGSGLVEVESIDAVAWRKTHTVNSLARSESNADIATFWLQFGAFSLERNAEGMLGRLQTQLGQLGESVHIVDQEGLFRLRAGPFKTVAEANDLAGEVKRLTNVQAMVLR